MRKLLVLQQSVFVLFFFCASLNTIALLRADETFSTIKILENGRRLNFICGGKMNGNTVT